MPYKFILLVVAFYFISLIQDSFASHFTILGIALNLSLVLVCLITFLGSTRTYTGIISAITAGFFLDILGGTFFGVSIIAMLFVYFFIKKVLDYLIDFPKKYSILYFIPILTLCTVFYGLITNFLISILSQPIIFRLNGMEILVGTLSNVILGVIGFSFFKIMKRVKHEF